jgi:hypothetical protein
MVDEHAIDRQNLNAALYRAITQQELFQAEMSAADEESEEAGLAGSELARDIQRIAIDIDRIKSDIVENDALAQERSILLATQQRELSKLKREKTVRRRATRASTSSPSTGGTTPIKVNDAAVGKARILYNAINELIHFFLPKANSSMGRSWEAWCVKNGFDEGGRLDILTFLYF